MASSLLLNSTSLPKVEFGNIAKDFDKKQSSTSMTSLMTMTSTSMTTLVTMSSLLFCIFCASVAGNLFVYLVFYKRPSMLTISNRFILNLTVCNSLNTIFVMPFMFTVLITQDWILGDFWCKATGFLMNTIFVASTLTLVAICIDRYSAVVTPLHYTMRITPKRSVAMILVVWIVAVASSIPPLVGWNRYVYQTDKASCTVLWASPSVKDKYYTLFIVTVSFILPLIVILWAYIVIFKAARTNSERTRRNSVLPNCAPDDNSQTPLRNGRRRSSSAPILTRRLSSCSRSGSLLWHRDEWKAALTSLIVVSTFVICWLPYFIIIILESLLHHPSSIYPVIETVSILLAMSSCACNPLVYVFRNKVARQELRVILRIQSREDLNFSRREDIISSLREGVVRQSSTESDITIGIPENVLHVSSTTTTLTSLIPVPSSVSLRS